MRGVKRNLSYEEVRNACKRFDSAKAAADYLGVDFRVFKRDASIYTDPETGYSFYYGLIKDRLPYRKPSFTSTITEEQVRDVMSKTTSNYAAAEYLKINYRTWRKVASLYKDPDGRTLFEVHKHKKVVAKASGVKRPYRTALYRITKESINSILNNEKPNFPLWVLKPKLLRFKYLKDECGICGFNEPRLVDGQKPFLLIFKHEHGNYNLDNLQLICYNCYFLNVGNLFGKKSIRLKDYKDEEDTDFTSQEQKSTFAGSREWQNQISRDSTRVDWSGSGTE